MDRSVTRPLQGRVLHSVMVGLPVAAVLAGAMALSLPAGPAFAGTVTVQPGQTLSQVAAAQDTTVGALAAANGIANPDLIVAGEVIRVPGPGDPAAPTGAPAATTVTVQPGDTMSALAARYGTTAAALAAANHIGNPDLITAGVVLRLPPSGAPTPAAPVFATVEVRPGETLSALAARYGTTAAALASANHIGDPNRIEVGTVLQVPGTAPGPAATGAAPPVMTLGTVTVHPGDTLTSLAAHYGTTAAALAAANHISDPNVVFAGMQLTLPAGTAAADSPGPPVPVATGAYPTALLSFPSRLALQPDFVHAASASGIPVALLEALCWWESGWRTSAVSASGAIGVCQIEPSTAAFVGSSILQEQLDPRSAPDNITLCAAYLRYLLNSTGGNAARALAGYYQGLSSLARHGTLPSTKAYVKGILAYATIFARHG